MNMAWVILVVAGLLEVGWALGLKASEGFTKPIPSVITIVTMVASFFLLSQAMKVLPVGTAYAIWVGIGAVGTVLFGILVYGDSATPLRIVSMLLVVAGLAGLKIAG